MNDPQPQQSLSPAADDSQLLMIPVGDRWQVFHRLQELEISCTCQPEDGLRVEVACPADAIQIWSVVRQLNTTPRQLVQWLEQCWQR